jgi:hypothetical protein
MNWLLLFFPIAVGLEVLAPERHLLVFHHVLSRHPAAGRVDGRAAAAALP